MVVKHLGVASGAAKQDFAFFNRLADIADIKHGNLYAAHYRAIRGFDDILSESDYGV